MSEGELTADDVTRLGRIAASKWRLPRREAWRDHVDIAVSGAWIGYLADPALDARGVMQAAWRALSREYGNGRRPGPLYYAYWTPPPTNPYEQVDDRIATRQIMTRLQAEHRNALLAIARAESTRQAAQDTGQPEWRIRRTVLRARHAFARKWADGDTPAPLTQIRRDDR
jgi:hypothetical protein